MSDLSNIITNQSNKVSLYVDDDIKLNTVFLPRVFVNWYGDFTRQPAILSIDSFDPDNITVHTSLIQKPLFSAQGGPNQSGQTVSTSGTYPLNFSGVNSVILNQNCGTFNASTGLMSNMTDGLYRITCNLFVVSDTYVELTSAFLGVIINNVQVGLSQIPIINGSINKVIGINNFLVNVVGGSVQFVFIMVNQSAGVFTLFQPSATLEMLSLS
jgi:hypothetical protein